MEIDNRTRSRKALIFASLACLVLMLVWLLLQREDGPIERPPLPSQTHAVPPPASTPPLRSNHGGVPLLTVQSRIAAFEAAFTTPIKFYGKVLDQYDNVVPHANVEFYANDDPRPDGSSSRHVRTTDLAGEFSIEGIRGINLSVAVTKSGYRSIPPSDKGVTSSGLFNYGGVTSPHPADKSKPVIFRLHKIGVLEPLVRTAQKNFRIGRNGAPLSISLDQEGGHQVVLRCWNNDKERKAGERFYDWRLEIQVLNGGLVSRKDAYDFTAPQAGYVSSDTVEMPASLKEQWRSFAERSYFIRFNDGTFARANLRMRAGGDHFVVWESFFNAQPESRNLENDPEAAARNR